MAALTASRPYRIDPVGGGPAEAPLEDRSEAAVDNSVLLSLGTEHPGIAGPAPLDEMGGVQAFSRQEGSLGS